MTKKMKKLLTQTMAAVTLFAACQQGFAMHSYADGGLTLTSKKEENVTVSVNGSSVTLTDTDSNNDVWNSKVLFEADKALVPGKEYQISFDLNGDNGVGELFLCKSSNLDDRYDETFTSEGGSRSYTFTAAGPKLYIGMQMGNIGVGNTVNAVIKDVCERDQAKYPALVTTANCDVEVEDGKITATDTNDNGDVWNSKLLYEVDTELEIGKTYKVDFKLTGDNGVGEFFVCKSADLNNRYDGTFINGKGNQSVTFTAENTKLYIGMQFGDIGKGNSVGMEIKDVSRSNPIIYGLPTLYSVKNEDGVLVICAVDNSEVNDVWNSNLLVNIYQDMIPGKQYEISYELTGENGVGEFFLCKTPDLGDRYDATFTNASGLNTVVFTAEGPIAYVGMQMGNIGMGNAVVARILDMQPYDPVSGGRQGVRVAQNCEQTVTREVTKDQNKTVISVTDTSEENDTWTSKLLYFFGNILETGKEYLAKINLSGNGEMGEFFFLKSDNMDDRYSYDNVAGDHTVTFTAESEKLYAGVQFGNAGDGKDFIVTITDMFVKPYHTQYTDNCEEDMNRTSVTLKDTDDNNDVWNSKAVYNTGITLEPGKEYTVTFTLTGENGVGEFFFLKSDNIDDRYSFDNTPGEHTITFTAEDTALFMGIQCGNIGNGNSMTVSNIVVTEKVAEEPEEEVALDVEEEVAEEEETAEVVEEEVVEVETTVEETEEVEAVEEETEEVETVEEETEETDPAEEETEEEIPAEEVPVEE